MHTKIKKLARQTTGATSETSNDNRDIQVKVSHRYIVVCPAFFDQILRGQSKFIDSVHLRKNDSIYRNHPEDIWTDQNEFTADVWQPEGNIYKLVYVEHQGRLFVCEDIMEVVALIEELKAAEAHKIISKAVSRRNDDD